MQTETERLTNLIAEKGYKKYFEVSINTLNPVIRGFFSDYFFLSNFFVCPVPYKGRMFHSSEAAYMSEKTDEALIKDLFANIQDPKTAKVLGSKITLVSDWEEKKVRVMQEVLLAKFLHNPSLAEKLCKTDDFQLEETNHWGDRFWGVEYDTRIGKNVLGKLLMNTRTLLQSLVNITVTANANTTETKSIRQEVKERNTLDTNNPAEL